MGYKIIKLPWPPLRKNLCTPLMALCPPPRVRTTNKYMIGKNHLILQCKKWQKGQCFFFNSLLGITEPPSLLPRKYTPIFFPNTNRS